MRPEAETIVYHSMYVASKKELARSYSSFFLGFYLVVFLRVFLEVFLGICLGTSLVAAGSLTIHMLYISRS